MRLPKLDNDKCYIGSSLWLPKKFVHAGPVYGALTIGADGQNEPRVLVKEHPGHLEVPRAFLSEEELKDLDLDIVDLRPTKFEKTSLRAKDKFSLREGQRVPWEALDKSEGGVFNLKCGGGKTVMGLLKAASLQVPTLIVSPQKAHLANWRDELNEFFEMDGEPGFVGDGKLDFEKDLVFSTVQTLARRIEEGALPRSFFTRFGLVIYDECHHMSAKWFCKAADISSGQRFGLTATVNRVDRTEGVYLAHLGPVFYTDNSDEMPVEFEIVKTGVNVMCSEDEFDISDVTGQRNVSLMRSWLAKHEDRNILIKSKIDEALSNGRTVYVLTHSVDHAHLLHEAYPNSGCITGKVPHAKRLEQLHGYPLVFATMGVGTENYNRKDLDTLFLLTPFSARDYASPAFDQARGRIQRFVDGKKMPIVYLFLDEVDEARGMVYSLIKKAKSQGFVVKGEKQWTSRKHLGRKA